MPNRILAAAMLILGLAGPYALRAQPPAPGGESPFLVGRMCSAYTLGLQGDLSRKPLAAEKRL